MEGGQQAQTTADSPAAVVSGTPDWSNCWFNAWPRGAVWEIQDQGEKLHSKIQIYKWLAHKAGPSGTKLLKVVDHVTLI